jgi:hypothetical protein
MTRNFKGTSGIVRKGLWLKSTEVAIKALNNTPEFTDASDMKAFLEEVEMLRLRPLISCY